MARRLRQLADLPVQVLDGVGGERAEALAHFGISSVLDLVTFYPRRYLDRTRQESISDLRTDDEAMVLGRVVSASTRRTRGGRALVSIEITDGTGRLRVSFFNQAWRLRQLPEGTEAVFFGRVGDFGGRRQMTNPVVDLVGDRTGRIIAVYPQSEKVRLTSAEVDRWVAEALARAGSLVDPVPEAVRERHGLIGRTAAFAGIHRPESMAAKEEARRRLVFDELLVIQLALLSRKAYLERSSVGFRHGPPGSLVAALRARLGFELTPDQDRVLAEIASDMARPVPMHRLLQGDVGSGKTVVAVASLLMAVEGSHQAAFMAPTEVLAEQHHRGIAALLEGLAVADGGTSLFGERPLRVELLTNSVTGAARERVLAGLADGSIDMVVGTHALIQEAVRFASLGAVVIDEQHRFGVEQRAALRHKSGSGAVPDVLVMTATPIPRTAAMTVYGDLDVSVIRGKPAQRRPIETVWVRDESAQAAAWDRVRAEVAAGRRAYVVVPLVEGSDKVEVRSAVETHDELAGGELAGLRLGLLHGRLPAARKTEVMDAFRGGLLDVLVATTVIEVGVDVPDATVMVVLDADRFGIAQLHQLRGRVGRGPDQSWCYLVGRLDPDVDSRRLQALEASDDGFELAEIDLDLRGEGTVFGERQKGRSDLRLASLRRDREWVATARREAAGILDADPGLAASPELRDELELLGDPADAEFLFKS